VRDRIDLTSEITRRPQKSVDNSRGWQHTPKFLAILTGSRPRLPHPSPISVEGPGAQTQNAGNAGECGDRRNVPSLHVKCPPASLPRNPLKTQANFRPQVCRSFRPFGAYSIQMEKPDSLPMPFCFPQRKRVEIQQRQDANAIHDENSRANQTPRSFPCSLVPCFSVPLFSVPCSLVPVITFPCSLGPSVPVFYPPPLPFSTPPPHQFRPHPPCRFVKL